MPLGQKTKKNLAEAFAGESMARNKYTYFASVAKGAGLVQLANIFLETAENEKEHAKLWAKQLGLISENKENLTAAIAGEHYETTEMYVRMAREAAEEGHDDIAQSFLRVARAELAHETRYKKLLENLEQNKMFKRDSVVRWKCANCGYIHEGKETPEKCPACQHAKGYFEIFAETY